MYGIRGSIPAPLKNQEYKAKILEILKRYAESRYASNLPLSEFYDSLPDQLKHTGGGDTTCVSVQTESGSTYMLDCGTGARVFGDELMKTQFGKGNGRLNIFITHTHWDHIQGLPFFKPVYIPGNEIHFYSPIEDLEQRLIRQQEKEYFPMPFHGTASKKTFHYLKENEAVEFEDGVVVKFLPLRHPGGSFAYKFTQDNKNFVFATDAEFTGEDMGDISRKYSFFGKADLLIMDAQYTLDESFAKFDWGHTSYTMAVNCATIWEVRNLVLTHHEPSYDDMKLFSILDEARGHKINLEGHSLKIFLAREGLKFNL